MFYGIEWGLILSDQMAGKGDLCGGKRWEIRLDWQRQLAQNALKAGDFGVVEWGFLGAPSVEE